MDSTAFTLFIYFFAVLTFLWGMRIIWMQRNLPGWRTALFLFPFSTLWVIAIANGYSSQALETKLLWLRLDWLCWSVVPTVWFAYGLLYNEWIKKSQWWHFIIVSIIPIVVFMLFVTNERHGIMYEEIWLYTGSSGPVLMMSFGPGIWVYMVYSYSLLAIGFITIIYKLIASKRFTIWQAGLLFLIVIAPWILVFYDMRYDMPGFHDRNLTALALVITNPVFIWSASRRRLSGITLHSLDRVFESLNTAVFLLGSHDRVLDLNRAGEQLVKTTVTQPQEKYFAELVDLYSGELDLSGDLDSKTQNISLYTQGNIRTYQANLSPVKNWLGQISGKLLVLSDITEQDKYLQETSALLDISTAVSSSLNIHEVLLTMAVRLLKLTHFNMCEIYEWDEESNQFILLIEHGRSFWKEDQGETYSLDEFPTYKKVLFSGEPVLINSTMDDPNADILREEGYYSSNILPIRNTDDQVVGLLEISHSEKVEHSPYDSVWGNLQNFSQPEYWLQPLNDFTGYKLVNDLEQLAKSTQASDCSISKWNRADNSIDFIASYTYATWERHQGLRYGLDEWASATSSVEEGQMIIVRKDDPHISKVDQKDLRTWNSEMLVVFPILVKKRIMGIVELYKIVDDGPIPEDTLQLWKNAIDQAAIALENARLFDQTNRALAAQIALRESSNVIVSALDTDTILSLLAEQVCDAASATSVYISQFNEAKTLSKVIAEYFSPEATQEEKTSDLGREYTDFGYEPFVSIMSKGDFDYSHIDDPQTSEEEIAHMKAYGAKSILYIPILVKAQLIGFIEIWESRKTRIFSPEEIRLCKDISRSAAVALENARLFEQAQAEIDERMKAEQIIIDSLQEKEILLKEIHHRVKNNLQIISSLLNLQSDQSDNQAISAFVNASKNRIRSMALIHEMLYQSENLAQVKFDEYIQKLTRHFRDLAHTLQKNILFKIDVDDVYLHIDAAIPCGLILTELVSNALEHAYPDDNPGIIQIEFFKDRHGNTLRVQDDGIGLAEQINFASTNTLGLQLVNSLVQQINGELVLDRLGGTKYTITFEEVD